MSAPDAYLTAEQLAARLGKTKRWVDDHCLPSCPDRLPRRKIGRTNRFSPDDVAAIDRRFAVDQPADTPLPALHRDPALLAKGLSILAGSRS